MLAKQAAELPGEQHQRSLYGLGSACVPSLPVACPAPAINPLLGLFLNDGASC